MEFLEYSFKHQEFIWPLKIFIAIFLTAIASLIFKKILIKGFKLGRKKKKNKYLEAKYARSIIKAASIFIWAIGTSITIDISNEYSNFDFSGISEYIRKLSAIFVFSWLGWRFIKIHENQLFQEKNNNKIDITTASAVIKLIKASLIITVILVTLQTVGIGISGILAFGGVGGIAIGFAAKDLLANFFGAMMIYMDRPFIVGDWIRSPDKEIEGTVEQIGWRLTHIRTFDKRMLYVPNSVFSSIAIENPSRMTHRRINEIIGLRYDDVTKIDKILNEIKEMLINHKEIDEKQTLMVNLDKFDDYSVNFFIYTFTHTTNWIKFHQIKQDILLKISKIIIHNKAEIAFPTSLINIEDEVKISNK